MSIELAVQIGIRSRLVSTAAVTVLVPAGNITDRNSRPALNPSIVLGEDQAVADDSSLSRNRTRVYSTLHVWKQEPSLAGVKAIAWAIRSAIRLGRLELGPTFHCADLSISSHRFLRDPDGQTSHAVITIETLVEELS